MEELLVLPFFVLFLYIIKNINLLFYMPEYSASQQYLKNEHISNSIIKGSIVCKDSGASGITYIDGGGELTTLSLSGTGEANYIEALLPESPQPLFDIGLFLQHHTLNNLTPLNDRPRFFSGICTTGQSTATKVVTCPEYNTPTPGDVIFVKFTNTNTATHTGLFLNVNSTGGKEIRCRYNGTITTDGTVFNNALAANQTVMFTYNGTYWILMTPEASSQISLSTGGAVSTTYYLMGTTSTISSTTGNTLYRYGTSGPYMTGADLFAGSDLMYKKDITSITDDFVEKLFERDDITYDFKWKENDKQSSGFIAQWIEDIMPEMVNGKEGEKHVNYNAALSKTVGALFKKIKQQQKEIDELKELIKNK